MISLSLVDILHYLSVNVQMAKRVVLRREGVLFATLCPYGKICTEEGLFLLCPSNSSVIGH